MPEPTSDKPVWLENVQNGPIRLLSIRSDGPMYFVDTEVRGRPFDSEVGAWQIWLGQIIYFQLEHGRKIYFQVYQGQNIHFHPQQNFEKSKKKKRLN